MIHNFSIATSISNNDTQSGYYSVLDLFSWFRSCYWYWCFFLFEIPKTSNLLYIIPNLSITAFNLAMILNLAKAFCYVEK